MKDIQTFAIGFLTCACMFLIMGQTKSGSSEKYQFAVQRGIDIGETYYLYDNETEDIQILHAYKLEDGEQKWSSINVNFRSNYIRGVKESLETIKKAKSSIIGK